MSRKNVPVQPLVWDEPSLNECLDFGRTDSLQGDAVVGQSISESSYATVQNPSLPLKLLQLS